MKIHLAAIVAAVALSGCASIRLEAVEGICKADAPGAAAAASIGQPASALEDVYVALGLPDLTRTAQASEGMAPPASAITRADIEAGSNFLLQHAQGVARAAAQARFASGAAQGMTAGERDRQRQMAGDDAADRAERLVPWLAVDLRSAAMLSARDAEANAARQQLRRIKAGALAGSAPLRLASTRSQPDGSLASTAIASFSRADSDLADEVLRSLEGGGYDALVLGSIGQMVKSAHAPGMLQSPSAEDIARLQALGQEVNTGRFISTYYRMYFRGGALFQASLDTKGLADKLDEELKTAAAKLSEQDRAAIRKALVDLLQKNCASTGANASCLLSKPLGEQSFVTRAGQSVQFAGVSLAIGSDGGLSPVLQSPKTEEVAPQLVRVLFEAIYDAADPKVPAVASSTACVAKLYGTADCLVADTKAAAMRPAGSITTAQRVKWVDEYATKTEATVTAGASKLIRGGYWASLNNEAVAKTIETMAGVNGRKIAEKVLWKLQKECESAGRPGPAGLLSITVR